MPSAWGRAPVVVELDPVADHPYRVLLEFRSGGGEHTAPSTCG
nr:F74 [uncultured bacterium]